MKIFAKEQLSAHKYKTPQGYLVCTDAILARTGKQMYKKRDFFPDAADGDSDYEVDRLAEDVFDDKAIASFENMPLVVEHPDEDVNSTNYKQYEVGFVRDVHKGEVNGQPVLLGNLVIRDEQTIRELENGEHTDLSCGYDCDVADEEHPHQTNIRGNHIALCREGRAGIAKIQDSKVKDIFTGQLSYKDLEEKPLWIVVIAGRTNYSNLYYTVNEIMENRPNLAKVFTNKTDAEKIAYKYRNYAPGQTAKAIVYNTLYFDVHGNRLKDTVDKHVKYGFETVQRYNKFWDAVDGLKPDFTEKAIGHFEIEVSGPAGHEMWKKIDDLAKHLNMGINDSKLGDIDPKEGEDKQSFISRFMSATKGEYPDRKQRLAVAYSYWDKHQHDCEDAVQHKFGLNNERDGFKEVHSKEQAEQLIKQRGIKYDKCSKAAGVEEYHYFNNGKHVATYRGQSNLQDLIFDSCKDATLTGNGECHFLYRGSVIKANVYNRKNKSRYQLEDIAKKYGCKVEPMSGGWTDVWLYGQAGKEEELCKAWHEINPAYSVKELMSMHDSLTKDAYINTISKYREDALRQGFRIEDYSDKIRVWGSRVKLEQWMKSYDDNEVINYSQVKDTSTKDAYMKLPRRYEEDVKQSGLKYEIYAHDIRVWGSREKLKHLKSQFDNDEYISYIEIKDTSTKDSVDVQKLLKISKIAKLSKK